MILALTSRLFRLCGSLFLSIFQLNPPCYFCIGWVVSTLLAGATVGSFTGGALADKFGRTRTFQLDVIPLAIGAFLWSVLYHEVQVVKSDMFRNSYLKDCLYYLQCHSPECADNDNWSLACWHWHWHFICYCATLYIGGSNCSLFRKILFLHSLLFTLKYQNL